MAVCGYCRVSSIGQNLDVQRERLEASGCDRIFAETISGKSARNRSELQASLDWVREGDVLVVTKLDRLARSAVDLGKIAELLTKKKVDLKVLDQDIDTTTPAGKLMFTMIGAFAEFERDLISERCAEGIKKAKSRGVKFGAPAKLSDNKLRNLKRDFHRNEVSKAELAIKYGISRASVYRLGSER